VAVEAHDPLLRADPEVARPVLHEVGGRERFEPLLEAEDREGLETGPDRTRLDRTELLAGSGGGERDAERERGGHDAARRRRFRTYRHRSA
jgi:hypothetical protein